MTMKPVILLLFIGVYVCSCGALRCHLYRGIREETVECSPYLDMCAHFRNAMIEMKGCATMTICKDLESAKPSPEILVCCSNDLCNNRPLGPLISPFDELS